MTTTDRSNGKANALGVIAVCVVIVVAGFACHPKRPPSQPAVRSASEEVMVNLEQETADPTMRGPLSYDHGFPVGWPHNLASAEDAAVTAVRATDRITEAGPLARRDLILTIATDEYGPTLAAETNQRIADLSFAVAGSGAGPADLTWGEYPLMFT